MHLDPQVRRASSVWHPMAPEETERGLEALRADLESGAWDERYGHLRAEPELVFCCVGNFEILPA